MADNKDIEIIEPLINAGIVSGGDDKQMVCENVKKLRLAEDKEGLEKYLSDLKAERTKPEANGDNSGLIDMIDTLTKRVEKLENQKTKPVQDTPKSGANNQGAK